MMHKLLLFFVFLMASGNLVAQSNSINEKTFISIGGIEQWVTISGEDKSKPVILFLHGGPGSTMSQYEDVAYGNWKKDFVLVNWDQRGAGRTFGKNAPEAVDEEYWIENPLTVDQMRADGIELSEYLIAHLGTSKITIIATSWGSILGAKMALARPDLYDAYIGHSQVVDFSGGLQYAYGEVYKLAQTAQDKESLDRLDLLGPPPFEDAKKEGQLLRIIKKYEAQNSTPAPDSWWKLKSEYDNEKDATDRYNGDDYSFIHFAGFKKMGIESMAADVDFMKDGLVYEIPVYFIQGEEDLLTPGKITKEYFDQVTAPRKEYILVPGAAHGHNQAVIDAQLKAVKDSQNLN